MYGLPDTVANSIVTLGEPMEISREHSLLDYTETYCLDGFYEPPINLNIFDQAMRSNTYCSSGVQSKRNILISTLIINNKMMSLDTAEKAIDDYLAIGNMYFYRRINMLGQTAILEHLPALYMRPGKDLKKYRLLMGMGKHRDFNADRIIHKKQHDKRQNIFGIPEWFSAISSSLLAENATLFRRKYYRNGAHAGFILYTNTPEINRNDEKAIQKNISSLKGAGNFRNIYINGRGKDSSELKLLPIAEVSAKDEFLNIKNITRDDMLAAHRVPPSLMGIIPQNNSGLGDSEKSAKIFYYNEIIPLQNRLLTLNDEVGIELLKTKPYALLEEKEKDNKK